MKRISIPIVTIAATTAALVPTWVWAQGPSDPDRYNYGPHMMSWGGGWFGMIFGPLFMILIFALTIAFAVLLVRWMGGSMHGTHSTHSHGPSPLDILKQRFARGEIDKEEFEERRRILEK